MQFAEEAHRLERELGFLILDSVTVPLGAVRLTAQHVKVEGYGRIFRTPELG
jgi:hypothetical protein